MIFPSSAFALTRMTLKFVSFSAVKAYSFSASAGASSAGVSSGFSSAGFSSAAGRSLPVREFTASSTAPEVTVAPERASMPFSP